MLMPNYTMQTRRFDLSGFLLLAVGMAVLTRRWTAVKVQVYRRWRLLARSQLVWWHWCFICCTPEITTALFQSETVPHSYLFAGPAGSFAGRIGSGMLPFMTPVFLQIGLGFSPFHAGLMMIPMVLGSMGMKRLLYRW